MTPTDGPGMGEDVTPGEVADLEDGLRRAFAQEAESISPDERLTRIRDDAALSPGRVARRWLAPLAAAAAVLLVGGLAWLLVLRPGRSTPVPIATDTVTAPAIPTASGSPSATSTVTSTSTARPSTASPAAPPAPVGVRTLPVYYVGNGTTAHPWLLYRAFLPGQQVASDASAQAAQAVTIALAGQDGNGHSLTAYDGFQQPWRPGTTASTSVGPAEIQVVLSGPGRTGLSTDQQRIAVQQLVWTATAAAGADLPVRVTTATGGAIFEATPAGVFRRPAATYEDLAPLWVTEPSRYGTLPSGRPVTVSGQACVFEAQFSWELSKAGAVVRSGTTTASSGCPDRGTYSIELGVLPAGDYSIRVFEPSAKDGSVAAETRAPFTVAGS
ncbi:MAG: Gmad2 immunoglobulin-like domain-containing protein [Dermatophilaceae bacterium]